MSTLILFDNEAVQALGDPNHPKHRRVLSHVEVVAQRRRRAVPVTLAVPTTVRVEAGWDGMDRRWALANHLRITDEPLGPAQANVAAGIRSRTGVSVTDAHLGAVIRATSVTNITVLTSDTKDVRAVAGARAVKVIAV
ncbi:MAG TPA: hypothetical protein VNF50_07790 [Acidimicrobiales bacterium]|nr:hypothetical protein [Acidimicrobiales bacterium]